MIDLVGPVQMVVYWVSTKIKSVQSYIKLRRLSRYDCTCIECSYMYRRTAVLRLYNVDLLLYGCTAVPVPGS
jgi:hypothetical protein